MRILVEALHIAAGIAGAVLIASICAWAYPLAARDIWLVTGGVILCIIVMGIGPMRRAMAADRGSAPGPGAGGHGDG